MPLRSRNSTLVLWTLVPYTGMLLLCCYDLANRGVCVGKEDLLEGPLTDF